MKTRSTPTNQTWPALKAIFLIICAFGIESKAQTIDKEKEHLTHDYKSGKYTPERYVAIAKEWREMISSFGYPTLPYDSITDQLNFTAIIESPGIPSKTITKRIVEWSATHFGDINAVLRYRDDESGKIIIKGFTPLRYLDFYQGLFNRKETISSSECQYTIIFTVKDGKTKIEFKNIEYGFNYNILTVSFSYTQQSKMMIREIYPVTQYPPIKWKGYLSLLKETTDHFKTVPISLKSYLLDYKKDYEF